MEMREYYQSSKWAEKRNARLKIDGFKCAKCGFTRALEIHHINYERFGDEDVSRDLITLCKKCHQEVEEQKRRINPVVKAEHHKVYLAGKITCNGWRENFGDYRNNGYSQSLLWLDVKNDLSRREYDVNDNLIITGPFFISCDHGCYHGKNTHGVGLNKFVEYEDGTIDWYGCCGSGEKPPCTEEEVLNICKSQIDRAEIVFAYIDCRDCFGTLAEIGYAHAKGKTIIIKFKDDDLERDMWFISKMQQKTTDVSDWWIHEQLISKIKED